MLLKSLALLSVCVAFGCATVGRVIEPEHYELNLSMGGDDISLPGITAVSECRKVDAYFGDSQASLLEKGWQTQEENFVEYFNLFEKKLSDDYSVYKDSYTYTDEYGFQRTKTDVSYIPRWGAFLVKKNGKNSDVKILVKKKWYDSFRSFAKCARIESVANKLLQIKQTTKQAKFISCIDLEKIFGSGSELTQIQKKSKFSELARGELMTDLTVGDVVEDQGKTFISAFCSRLALKISVPSSVKNDFIKIKKGDNIPIGLKLKRLYNSGIISADLSPKSTRAASIYKTI